MKIGNIKDEPKKTNGKMVDLNPIILIITLNINSINSSIISQRLSN